MWVHLSYNRESLSQASTLWTPSHPKSPHLSIVWVSARSVSTVHVALLTAHLLAPNFTDYDYIRQKKRRYFDVKRDDDKLITVCYVKEIIIPILNNGIVNKRNIIKR